LDGLLNITKEVSGLGLSPGYHNLTFHIIEEPTGCISDGFLLRRHIYRFRSSLVPVRSGWSPSGSSSNFDVWFLNTSDHRLELTGGRGFRTLMRPLSYHALYAQVRGLTFTLSSVYFSTTMTQVSDCVILIAIKLENRGASTQYIHIECDTDLCIDGDDFVEVADLPDSRGFYASNSQSGFTFICGLYPLTLPVTTYWYGHQSARHHHYWANVSNSWYSGDSGCAWSWQSIEVPGNSIRIASILIRSGFLDLTQPIVTIMSSLISDPLFLIDELTLVGSISTRSSSIPADLILIVDSDLSNVIFVARTLPSGLFNITKTVSTFGIPYGFHELSFYCIDIPYGCISSGSSFKRFIHRVRGGLVAIQGLPYSGSSASNFDLYGQFYSGSWDRVSPFPVALGLDSVLIQVH
jgi:hypothetical protein